MLNRVIDFGTIQKREEIPQKSNEKAGPICHPSVIDYHHLYWGENAKRKEHPYYSYHVVSYIAVEN